MPRPTSSALDTELDKRVTSVGYLLQINGSETRRWSNLGDVTYLGVPWIGVGFEISNLKWSADQDPSCSLKVQNLDEAVAGWFLNEPLADATIDLYQFARGALADGDAVQIGRLVFDGATIKLDALTANLVAESSLYAFSPVRRVNAAFGFKYALPVGTQIAWGNEIYIVGETDNSG